MRLKFIAGLGAALGVLAAIGAAQVLACTSIATLNSSQAAGAPGTDITLTGSSFGTVANGATAVSIRWNGVSGPVLAQVAPDASGSIAASIKIPADLEPGYYVITATQDDKNGNPAFGTPARIAFQVNGPVGSTTGSQSPGQPAGQAPTGNSIGAGTLASLAGLGAVGLLLFLLGAASFIRSYRRSMVPSAVRKS